MIKHLSCCCLGLVPQVAFADDVDVLTFLGQHGCVVGAQTQDAAIVAGLEPEAVAEFIASLDPADVEMQGSWQVLSQTACTIVLPVIEPVLQHDDPDVRAAWSEPDAYREEFDELGCFFNLERLTRETEAKRGWTEAQTYNAYLEYVAAGIISGEIRFYSDNPFLTPVSIRLMGGDCAVGDDLADIWADHEVLRAAFGPYLRHVAPGLECGADRSTSNLWPQPDIEALTGMTQTNAHLTFEIHLVMLGAGWIERDLNDVQDRGTLRPPACVYPRNP